MNSKEQKVETSTEAAIVGNTVLPAVWIDNKGRQVEIHTMSDRWLNNIRKKFKGTEKVEPILAEIKRRKLKRNGR